MGPVVALERNMWEGAQERGWSSKTRVGTDGKTGGEDTVEEPVWGGAREVGSWELWSRRQGEEL